MSDFLLELRSEEIPARMQAGARSDLEKLFRKEMDAAGVALGQLTVWSTPRRLTLIARGLPEATAAVSEELKGPRVGAPPQALEGFLRKTGLSEGQLTERDGVLYAVTEKPGRATADVLAEAIPAIIRAFPWPKSQRWGAASMVSESLRWVRPLSGIVALFDDAVVPCEVGGVSSGRLTRGHRFHSAGEITIDGADDYAAKLRAAHVIVDHAERQDLIRTTAAKAAADAGLTLVEDEGLVIENAGLTEWPVPLLGRFDEAFLDVPPEVIQLTARTNQKYFVCKKPSPLQGRGRSGGAAEGVGAVTDMPHPNPSPEGEGLLANAFVCTANIAASDGGAAIVDGNRKVLAARLSDARFFWEQDRRMPLAQHAEGLARITFHEKLGPLSLKAERIAKLASWFGSNGIGNSEDNDLAARLCKSDLTTLMVGEFPELQGKMGFHYARAESQKPEVAAAIFEHYLPIGQGSSVPTAPTSIALALADRLDTLGGFFRIGLKPTGSKDPYALRRAAIGLISIILENKLRISLRKIIGWQNTIYETQFTFSEGFGAYTQIYAAIRASLSHSQTDKTARDILQRSDREEMQAQAVEAESRMVSVELLEFIVDRLKVQQREAGVRHDLIDAVFALGGEDDLVRLLARVHALQAFVGTEDGANLLAGYKRAANILKKEGVENAEAISLSYTPEPAEDALIKALDAAEPRAAEAVAAEDFSGAMAALASLRGPIDAFFEQVTVNDADDQKRSYRLALLARLRDAVHGVADFSRIEG